MEITLSKLIDWAIDALIKRSLLLVFVMLSVSFLTKKDPRVCERYPDTPWNTRSVFQLLFIFLLIEYTLHFLLGAIFYRDLTAFFNKTQVWRNELGVLLFYSFMLCTIWYVVTHKYQQPFRILGFQKDKLGSGLVWGLGILLFHELFLVGLKYYRKVPISSDNQQINFLWLLPAIIVTPVAEEIFFRGYIYPNFRKRVGIGWAILLSSTCFVIFHPLWKDWLSLFIIGIVFCFIYEKSGSLIAPIMGHIFKNLLAVAISSRSIILIYYVPWSVIWFVIAITIFIYLLILRYTPLPPPKTSSVEIKKLTVEDVKKIKRDATRRGWIVAVILGAVIMYFLYFFKK